MTDETALSPLILQAAQAAAKTLEMCCADSGLMASGARIGHHQIWARDSMIALLGARFLQNDRVRHALRDSIGTLKSKATPLGAMPNNVDALTGKPNFRAYADGGLWWIIGSSLIAPDADATRAILRWYACHDVDQSGLISMQEGADWQDLFCTRGKGLYLNCLYVIALRHAAKIHKTHSQEDSREYTSLADRTAAQVNRWLWYKGDEDMLSHIAHSFSTDNLQAHDSLGRKRWLPQKRVLHKEQYYLPYLSFREVGEWFDTLGNLLAILGGIADAEKTHMIMDFIRRHGICDPPARAIHPIIEQHAPDWREYYGALNAPHHYHNGGVWPFIGGFYVAALVKTGKVKDAAQALHTLAGLNLAGNFNEWHRGDTMESSGVEHQAWSAGMYLFALECVKRQSVEGLL
jgi:hypothetical protein